MELYDVIDINRDAATTELLNGEASTRLGRQSNSDVTGKSINKSRTEFNSQSGGNTQKSMEEMDADYQAAVEKGDREQLEWLVKYTASRAMNNSKVVDGNGQLIKMYHGTNADFKGYQLTAYLATDGDLSRENAIQAARDALKKERAALDSAVLTEYEGERSWLIGMVIREPEDGTEDEEDGQYIITVGSPSGDVKSIRKSTTDDSLSGYRRKVWKARMVGQFQHLG